MSNNLGQIYATSKHAEKYIILDSQNVEVSGNFYINGTNSRLPAELENSIRNYLPLTYGTTDPNPNTLYDVISEVSNNLLISNNDASFGNVDISGNLTLKGSLGVLDTSTNDISYGAVGSILTSNGSGSVPTWNEPYYFGASLTTNQSVPSDAEVQIDFVPYLASPYDGNNSDMTTGIWTCHQTGLYRVSLSAIVSTNGDDIRSSDLWIISNDGTSDTREAGAKYFNNANDDIQVGTLNCESLIALSAGHTIKGTGRIVISSGGGRTFEQNATFGGKGTVLTITRIV